MSTTQIWSIHGDTYATYREGMRTPWGVCDSVTRLADGVFLVQTPGHGGIMVDAALATRGGEAGRGWLSPAARRVGQAFTAQGVKWIAFEEDCAVNAVLYEHAEVYPFNPATGRTWGPGRGETVDELRASAFLQLRRWFPAYQGVPGELPAE